MDFRPAWDVDCFILGKNYFCFECIVIFCVSDFVLYEYTFSLNSSQNSFYIPKYWKSHSKSVHSALFLGPKNLAEYQDQTV